MTLTSFFLSGEKTAEIMESKNEGRAISFFNNSLFI